MADWTAGFVAEKLLEIIIHRKLFKTQYVYKVATGAKIPGPGQYMLRQDAAGGGGAMGIAWTQAPGVHDNGRECLDFFFLQLNFVFMKALQITLTKPGTHSHTRENSGWFWGGFFLFFFF
jgi:hypothetical protein